MARLSTKFHVLVSMTKERIDEAQRDGSAASLTGKT
jgi:hypothetical protein